MNKNELIFSKFRQVKTEWRIHIRHFMPIRHAKVLMFKKGDTFINFLFYFRSFFQPFKSIQHYLFPCHMSFINFFVPI